MKAGAWLTPTLILLQIIVLRRHRLASQKKIAALFSKEESRGNRACHSLFNFQVAVTKLERSMGFDSVTPGVGSIQADAERKTSARKKRSRDARSALLHGS